MITLGATGAIICLLLAAAMAYGLWKLGSIVRYEVQLAQAGDDEPQNFLLVGSDSRDSVDPNDPNSGYFLGEPAGGRRADTIMIARIDPATTNVALLSIPRDLWVPIAGTGSESRINSAYADGPQQLIDTVQDYLDVEIHHFVEIDFGGFQRLIDAVDGVPLYFDAPMRDAGSGLVIESAGCHNLDGATALAFARSRHLQVYDGGRWRSDPSGDLGRSSRQQLLMRRAVDRAVSLDLANPLRLNEVLSVAADSVSLDDELGTNELFDLARTFQSFSGDRVQSYALPVYDFRTAGGAAVLGLSSDEAQDELNIFRGLDPDDISPAFVEVTVLNGSRVSGQAGDIADALAIVGFRVVEVGNADGGPHARTTILYPPGLRSSAELVEQHLTSGAELVESPDSGIVIVTGTDFTTVRDTPRPAGEDPAPAPTAAPGVSADGGDEQPTIEALPEAPPSTLVGITPQTPPGVTCG